MIALIKQYGTYIAGAAIIAVVGLVLRFTYNAGYEAAMGEVRQATNEALVNDKREADNVRMDEQRINSDGIDDALASIGILRD